MMSSQHIFEGGGIAAPPTPRALGRRPTNAMLNHGYNQVNTCNIRMTNAGAYYRTSDALHNDGTPSHPSQRCVWGIHGFDIMVETLWVLSKLDQSPHRNTISAEVDRLLDEMYEKHHIPYDPLSVKYQQYYLEVLGKVLLAHQQIEENSRDSNTADPSPIQAQVPTTGLNRFGTIGAAPGSSNSPSIRHINTSNQPGCVGPSGAPQRQPQVPGVYQGPRIVTGPFQVEKSTMHERLNNLIQTTLSQCYILPPQTRLPATVPATYSGSSKFSDLQIFVTLLCMDLGYRGLGGSEQAADRCRVLSLPRYLRGEAHRLLMRRMSSSPGTETDRTFEGIIHSLFDHFVLPTFVHKGLRMLNQARYDPALGIWKFYDEIIDAVECMMNPPSNRRLVDVFLRGITKEMRESLLCVRGLDPDTHTLEEFRDHALSYESQMRLVAYVKKTSRYRPVGSEREDF